MRNYILFSTTLLAAAACGGGQKTSGGSGGSVPPPPQISKSNGGGGVSGDVGTPANTPVAPQPAISKDARADYTAAVQYFDQNDKGHSWNDATCRTAADKFQSVVSSHSELIVAQVMVGTSFARCGMWGDAEKAYTQATHMKGDPAKQAQALSNLGEIYFMQGKTDGAKQYWTNAVSANGKLVGARIGLASLTIDDMHRINNPKDQAWKNLETDARQNLSNALGVDSDSVAAYAAYARLYMEGSQQNKNRLDLAKLLLDEGANRDKGNADLQNAFGLYWMKRGALNQANAAFMAAVQADPKFVEARLNAGFLNLGFRKYDVAKDLFSKAIELQPKNYDAIIGLGVAMRGLNDLDGAEAAYKKAQQLNPQRGRAYYNLGVLYKDFRANKQNDPDPVKALRGSQSMYKTAHDYFQQFADKDGTPEEKQEAKNNIGDCEKVVKQLDQAIVNLQNAPPPPPAPPAQPAAAPAAGAGSAPAPAPAGGAGG